MNEPHSSMENAAEGCDVSAGNLPAGTMISGFRIEREIGRGGMGVVYLATQMNLQRDAAVKVLADDLAGNAVFVQRFFQEAHSAACLSHPNIVQAYDAGVASGVCYFAMEYVDGETLETRLRRDGPLPVRSVMETGSRIACALGYAWNSRGMSHGDIKPDNILISRSGELKLADLGLARSVYDEDAPRDVMVTPLYAPPEIISGKVTEPNLLSDIYSFGATLYHAAAGTPPFPAEEIKEIYRRHIEEIPRPPSDLNPEVPEALSSLILRMLEKNPENRPASWEEIEEAFQNMLEESQPGKPEKRQKKTLGILLLISSILLLLTAGIAWFVRIAVGVRDSRTVRRHAVSRKSNPKFSAAISGKKEVSRTLSVRERKIEMQEKKNAEAYLRIAESFCGIVRFAPVFGPEKVEEMLRSCRMLMDQGKLPHLAEAYGTLERELNIAKRILELRSASFRELPVTGTKSSPRKKPVVRKKIGGAELLRRRISSFRADPGRLKRELENFSRKYRKSFPLQSKQARWIAEAITPEEGLHPLYFGWSQALKGLPVLGFEENCEFYELKEDYLWLQFRDGIMRIRRKYPASSSSMLRIRASLLNVSPDSDFWKRMPAAIQRYVVIGLFFENPARGSNALAYVTDPILKRDLSLIRTLIEKSGGKTR